MPNVSLIATKKMKKFCPLSECIDSEKIKKLAEKHNIKVTTFPETVVYTGKPTKIFVIDQKDLPKLEKLVCSIMCAYLFERLSDYPEIKKSLLN